MRISLLQMDLAWNDVVENLRRAEHLLYSSPTADVYVLPEMFSTGFCIKPEQMNDSVGEETLRWMVQCAQKREAALVGSTAVKTAEGYFNRMYFVEPDGTVTFYDKRHLFSYSGEDRRYKPGNRRVIVTYKGVRFLLQVCYDLRFPVWSRNRKDYDVALYVANWPVKRRQAWNVLLKARAIENQCYVVGVNRVGKDENCTYEGDSALIDAYGESLAFCGEGEECVVIADIDLESLHSYRLKFPSLEDADSFDFCQ